MSDKTVYWKCGGGPLPTKWGYGYWTGPDNDLLCVKPNLKTTEEAESNLSPIKSTKAEAKRAFNKGGE